MRDGQESLATRTPPVSGADEEVAEFTQNYLARLLGHSNGTGAASEATATAAPPPRPAPPARSAGVELVAAAAFGETEAACVVAAVAAPVVKVASSAENKAILEDLAARLQPLRQVAASVARSAIADHRADRRKSLIVIAALIGAAALLAPLLFWVLQ